MNVETVQLEVDRVLLLGVRVHGSISDAEYLRWLDRYQAIHSAARERDQRLAVLYDLSDAPPLTAQQRRLQSEWNERVDDVLHAVTVAVAFVTKSTLIRGVMTAIFWFNPPKAPHRVFGAPAEGLEWLLEQCERDGRSISPGMRLLARDRLLMG